MEIDWRSSIAGADFADWFTVGLYLLCAVAASRASRFAQVDGTEPERLFWRITAGLMIIFGVNELLDLQTILTSFGRAHAMAHDWYDYHRQVQYAFVLTLSAGAVAIGATIIWAMRRTHASVRSALLGITFIGTFILLRAASFNHFDELLGRDIAVLTLGSVQEWIGIMIVSLAARAYSRRTAAGNSQSVS